ncbi:arsenate reductase/protein-tyrosine-phosphatase family protein [Vibrio alfacsensis]|uniref:arsenate reductase/protein-tyrosine-phosphatase family protein n=1 Tax=Vibrio TaxID=662 RepID=UPI00406896FD
MRARKAEKALQITDDFEAQTTKIKKESPTVLVLGEDTRSFLSVIRSLGRAGYTVHVVCYDRKSASLQSKYISQSFFYNYQAYTHEQWLANVLCLVERYHYDVIFPCDERAIYPLWKIRGSLPVTTKLAIANQESLDVLFDKWKTKKVARRCQVPVANGNLIKHSQYDYQQLKNEFGEKFVLKPLQSFEMTSLEKRNKVVIVNAERDFTDFIHSNSDSKYCLVESYFKGNGEGLSVLSLEGKVHSAFSYRRLAEPYSGGGSSYRVSTEIEREQLTAVEAICRETKLTGLAMFEFRRNLQTNQWILVEVNARVWGGLPLAEYAGVDFPRMYVDYLYHNVEPSITGKYSAGITARSLTSDLYEIKRESEKFSREGGRLKALTHMGSRLAKIMRCIAPKESIDSLRIDDPKPFIAEVRSIRTNITNPILKKNRYLTLYRRWKVKGQLRMLLLSNPRRRVVFICYGNIIRSPFAERYFSNLLISDERTLPIDSFGFHQKERRTSPNIAKIAAQQMQCDLNHHTSKCLSQLDLNETDIVIYFDEKNRHAINTSYRIHHAYCAADFLDSRYPDLSEIEDPYESDVETIAECYKKITNALNNFIEIYREAKR